MPTRRPGLTLIELLIAVAIIALLIGLLLPAIQAMRATAAGAACTNNLRQLALGCQQSYTTRGRMPLAGGPFDATVPGQIPLEGSAHFFLLPYVDQLAAQSDIGSQAYQNPSAVVMCGCWYHQSVRVTRSTGSVVDLQQYPMSRTPTPYVCPAEPTSDSGVAPVAGTTIGVTSYAANLQAFGHIDYTTPGGTFVQKFKDGASNTILFTERYTRCRGVDAAWLKVRPDPTAPVFALRDPLTGAPDIRLPQIRPSDEECDPYATQSPHFGFINVAMGDASVRRVNPGISLATWASAILPADGRQLGSDW